MALQSTVIEVYYHLIKWYARIDVLDTDTSIRYHYEYSAQLEPTQQQLNQAKTNAENQTQRTIDIEANDMNLPVDEEMVLEHYQIIKTEIITQIRAFPAVTIDQARSYLNTNYPDSVIDFDNLYAYYLDLLNLSTWDQFKTFVITHTFEGID